MKLLLYLTLPLYILDQLTKWSVLKNFPHPGEGMRVIEVIPGFFEIVRVHNTGMAFGGFNNNTYSNVIFCVISSLALAVIALLWRKNAFPTKPGKIAAALLLAGIIGNLTDRFLHQYVVDFLSFDLGFMVWPSFNVADSCISIAAILLLVTAFMGQETPANAKSN